MRIVPNLGERSAARPSIAEARRAFFQGDFDRCVILCEAIGSGSDAIRFEAALLRARVLLRLDLAEKAIDALRACAYTPLSADEYVSGEMILGASYVRLGQLKRGAAMLERARADPRPVHPTIRAEVAVNLGVARYVLGQFDEAESMLRSVGPEADIIYGRAQEYLGWLYFASNRVSASVETFGLALAAVDRSKNRDPFVEANILKGLTAASAELLHVASWPTIQSRIQSFDWSPNGLGVAQFWTSLCASVLCELEGDIIAARDWTRRAEMVSTDPSQLVIAQCRMAALFRAVGERHAQVEFAMRARRTYDQITLRHLVGDFKQVPIALAEELAYVGLNDEAGRLVRQFRDLVHLEEMRSLVAARLTGVENSVEAALLEASGHRSGAVRLYEIAFSCFQDIGFRRRACFVAFRLAEITGEARYVDYLRNALSDLPNYWLTRELSNFDRTVTPRLSSAQADILDLVAEGKTYKEIAALRGGSWKTARNLVHALFRKFEVRSKGELVAAAARRGLLDRSAKDSAK